MRTLSLLTLLLLAAPQPLPAVEGPVARAVNRHAPAAEARLAPFFRTAQLSYPPQNLAFVVLKEEKMLEVWGRTRKTDPWAFVRDYPILAASGKFGPKLQVGDLQVPEGFYKVVLLNPRSSFHLSFKLDYPNRFDQEMARRDGRTNLGGDIFVHGEDVSIGCLAMGNPAIEELFVLVAKTGLKNVEVIILPRDLRRPGATAPSLPPAWTRDLYAQLANAVKAFMR